MSIKGRTDARTDDILGSCRSQKQNIHYLTNSLKVGCGLSNGRQALQYFSLTSPELEISIVAPPLAITAASLAAVLLVSTLVFCACRQTQGKKRELRNKI